MSEVKNIKGIDDATWAKFKSIAARQNLTAAKMFRVIIDNYERKTFDFWDELLNHKPILTSKEYDELELKTQAMRKDYGWRI